jgi:RimJ/RimL family protein N-acetyltransferase
VLGGASLYAVELAERRAAVGYLLAARARGRGVATCATRLLARWGFDRLGLERLELTCGPDNVASQRVAERCGFTREARAALASSVQGRPARQRRVRPAAGGVAMSGAVVCRPAEGASQ